MTLRDSGHESVHRTYSVSRSGKYKSRPKIRAALSGDLFRPDPSAVDDTKTANLNNRSFEASAKVSANESNQAGDSNNVGTNTDSSEKDTNQTAQHHNRYHHHRPHSKGVIETAL
ncbi:1-phosphatidylinositol 3-phosphate 5-kinase-like [Topomyia yanbarensis]|uniref:1-phosphatidylinositol 3-phosphate 5-kinase-like n=1 Tax=Topomyia yanbarensis TaxID=2498891 RepID=UPI00273B9DB1|nr:1-phosphatidylinositol 3-phosphate 5-kinase-like [Topomyia yanbarensis]